MKLFRSKYEKELDAIIEEIDINLSNNYKSVAHAAREKLGRRCEELHTDGKINDAVYKKYFVIFEQYTEMMKNYHH